MTRPRRNPIPYLALLLVLAVGVGGGYAVAASKNKTITVCADKATGVLHLKTHGRCQRGQTRVTWNQQGPEGRRGVQGPAGQPGPAVSVWANVTNTGSVFAGRGMTVQHVSAGTYQVTITDAACAHATNAPVVTIADGNPPAGQTAGAFPVAWFSASVLNQQFTVFTGVVVSGSFTPTDHTFTVIDTCM